MRKATLDDISFDKEDALLFSYSDDLLLKAKAIQSSILPKLQVLLQESISLIRKIYGIEALDEDSHIVWSPHFREKRENSLRLDYDYALMGISGSRLPVWGALKRDDGRLVKIIPVHLQYEFSSDGFLLRFCIDERIDLSSSSLKKLLSVLVKNIESIIAIANRFSFQLLFPCDENDLFSSVPAQIKKMAKSAGKKPFALYIEKFLPLPVGREEISALPLYFAAMFPVYDALLRAAKGERSRFKELIGKLRDFINALSDDEAESDKPENAISESVIMKTAARKIDTIGIRAGIRWQVFERDDFRCVACGATALDGAILHVDHILPRSKGGKDSLENYQTLCQTCNIGKGNRSERNLRAASNETRHL